MNNIEIQTFKQALKNCIDNKENMIIDNKMQEGLLYLINEYERLIQVKERYMGRLQNDLLKNQQEMEKVNISINSNCPYFNSTFPFYR